MANLIIKPQNTSGDKVIIQDQAGGAVLTTADNGATIGGATIINTSESGTFGKDVTVGSSAAGATVLQVLGGEAGTAEINLFPDQADDNPDKWKIIGKTDSSFQISTYNSGAYLPGITLQPDSSVNGAHTILGEFQSGRTFSNVQLQVNDVQNNAPIIAFVSQSVTPNAGSRNWCMRSNAVAYGDFCFMLSATSTGTPVQGTQHTQLLANGSLKTNNIGGEFYPKRTQPQGDNAYQLGDNSARWSTVYRVNESSSSDERQKKNIVDSDLGLDFINLITPRKFKWKAENIPSDAQAHRSLYQYGMIAQEVETVLNDAGIESGFLHKEAKNNPELDEDGTHHPLEGDDADTYYGLDYQQFISPLIKAVQELSAKVTALENA